MRKWNFNQFFSFNNSFTQTSCLSSKMHSYPLGNVWEGNVCNSIIHDSKPSRKQHFKNALLTVLLLSWMTWVFAQATKTGKETLKKEPPIHIVANDSVDIAGFRVSQDEAKIYEGFLKDREIFASEEQMIDNYKKRIARLRERKLLAQQLAEAKREEAWLDQDNEAIKNRIAVKKEDNEAIKNEEKKIDLEKVEIERKYEELKQQLFQAREKKLGRPLTNKEKEEILDNIHKKQ